MRSITCSLTLLSLALSTVLTTACCRGGGRSPSATHPVPIRAACLSPDLLLLRPSAPTDFCALGTEKQVRDCLAHAIAERDAWIAHAIADCDVGSAH